MSKKPLSPSDLSEAINSTHHQFPAEISNGHLHEHLPQSRGGEMVLKYVESHGRFTRKEAVQLFGISEGHASRL